MEELMAKYKISNVLNAEEHSIDEQKCLLWVWHADKIPPHLGLSIEGKYFSLKANGKDFMAEIDSVKQIISRKEIKTLCFELKSTLNVQDIADSFNKYESTIPFEITCLKPIQEVLNSYFSKQLIDLLVDLDDKNQIQRVFGYNILEGFDSISEYTTDDIHARLKQLKDND
jgi:hypothetical protein